MNHNIIKYAVALALMTPLGAVSAFAAGDATAGASVFQNQCAMCHSVTPGTVGIGPSLAGVYGKPAASSPGYQYSPALIAAKLVWNDATLDKFLTSPQSDVPGTKMPFAGMTDAGQRADVIAYLATLKGG